MLETRGGLRLRAENARRICEASSRVGRAIIIVLLICQAAASASADRLPPPPPGTDKEASPSKLVRQWDDASRIERIAIAQTLRSNSQSSLPELRQTVVSGAASQKMLALGMLREAKDKDAENVLIVAMRDPSPRIQVRATTVLGYVGGSLAIHSIKARMEGATGGVLKACLAALGRLHAAEDIPLIRKYLQYPDESVRVNAATSLAYLGSSEGLEILLSATRSTYTQAAREATYALGFLSGPAAESRLQEILSDPEARWRTEARMALSNSQLSRLQSLPERIAYLSGLARDKNRHVALWAVQLLADENAPEARAQLLALSQGGGKAALKAREQLSCKGFSPTSKATMDAAKHAKPVHQYLCERAFERISGGFYDSGNPSAVRNGAWDEDEQDLRNQPGWGSWLRHFYNPQTGNWLFQGLLGELGGDMSAKDSARQHWDWASAAYGSTGDEYNGAFHLLGQTVHLLEDMSSPAHTHLDVHVDVADETGVPEWLVAFFYGDGGDDFEDFGPSLVSQISYADLSPRNLTGKSIETIIHEMARYTYDFTAYQGVLEYVWGEGDHAQPDSELHDMFGSGLYYHNGGWLGDNYWYIDNVGEYDDEEVSWADQDWWPCEGDNTRTGSAATFNLRISGNFYIENSGGDDGNLKPITFRASKLHYTSNPSGMTLLQIYANELYKECVRYCAGLLDLYEASVPASVSSFSINSGAASTTSRTVALNNSCLGRPVAAPIFLDTELS